MYYAYILYSQKLNKYYVGSTNNIKRRIEEHNRGKTAFSKQGYPWALKYSEVFSTRNEAVKRELEIKN